MQAEWKNLKKQGSSGFFKLKDKDKKVLQEAAKRRLDAKNGKK